jgi:hypothetical protein
MAPALDLIGDGLYAKPDAGVAKPVDARDLKSLGPGPCGFDPRRPHQSL